jgi:hypothetical protein
MEGDPRFAPSHGCCFILTMWKLEKETKKIAKKLQKKT